MINYNLMWAWYILDNKIMDKIKNAYVSLGRKRYILIIGFVGIILILLSDMIPASSSKNDTKNVDYQTYIQQLEKETKNIISSIDGVGECKVMLTLCETDENVYGKNTDESTNNGSISTKNEYIFYEENNEDKPVLIKQYFPKVMGVVIVCQGGDRNDVKEQIINAVSSLFDISSNKISVSKLNK